MISFMRRKTGRTTWNPAFDTAPTSDVPRIKFSHKYSRKYVECANYVVEIGCGTGSFTRLIDDVRCIGIDLDIHALHVAKRYCPQSDFIAASGTNLPFRDGTLD
ncbi:MAG: class I SAM-dependent methyltransferase, partial [Acidobacteriota bacterium]